MKKGTTEVVGGIGAIILAERYISLERILQVTRILVRQRVFVFLGPRPWPRLPPVALAPSPNLYLPALDSLFFAELCLNLYLPALALNMYLLASLPSCIYWPWLIRIWNLKFKGCI